MRKLGYTSYSVYLKSPHWMGLQRRYRAAWKSACCLACGSPEFQLHHIRYSRLGRESLRDLLPFCARCHNRLHKFHKALRVALPEFLMVLTLGFKLDSATVMNRLEGYSRIGKA